MRILYTAKMNKGCNDNEGAISYALRKLGHHVDCVHENKLRGIWGQVWDQYRPDLLLFQNWKNPPDLSKLPCPKVFWYMDRIDYGDDPILEKWTEARMKWMNKVTPYVTMGVCTDGDWVNRDTTGKLFHLMQGADERVACCPDYPIREHIPLLFTGWIYGRGEGRKSWVEELKQTYGRRFVHHTKLFRRPLINAVHKSKIVLAPDGPVSDLYFSNRMALMLSFGAFMLHPYCAHAAEMYEDGKEIVFYKDREDMHKKIRYYMGESKKRHKIARAGYERTMREHLYRHKLQIILSELERRL